MIAEQPSLCSFLSINIEHGTPTLLFLNYLLLQLSLKIKNASHCQQIYSQTRQIGYWLSHVPSVLAVGDTEEKGPV